MRTLYPVLVVSCMMMPTANATIDTGVTWGPALIGPSFKHQPWRGQPGYDEPGPAPMPQKHQRYTSKRTLQQLEEEQKQREEDAEKQAKSGATKTTQQANTTEAAKTSDQATSRTPSEDQKSRYQFGERRYAPNYQPGNAQQYFKASTGQTKDTDFNQQRYKQIPDAVRNLPGWQSGHFITQPKKSP